MTVFACSRVSAAQLSAAAARSAWVASMTWRASSIAAVSMMSWLVAPRWIASANSAGTRAVMALTRAGIGLPAAAAETPSDAFSIKETLAIDVMAAPAPGGASPARSAARAMAASVSSIACSQVVSSMTTEPASNRPLNRPRRGSSFTVP